MYEVANKNVVITGGGSGIGRGMAIAFAREGMNVLIADIDKAAADTVSEEIEALGVESFSAHVDVTQLSSVEALAAMAFDRFQEIHVLCNNAGVMAYQPAAGSSHEDWKWVIDVNLWGVIHGVETFLPRLLAQGQSAHIVNTSSIAGVIPSAISAVYSTTKFAVVGLSETLREELSGTMVGISVLCPGAVNTRIGDSDRNRPAGWVQTKATPRRPGLGGNVPALDPVTVGEMVLSAIRQDRLFIFTEPSLKERVAKRASAMLAAFDAIHSDDRG